jgi:uncharacterized ubiquitin-like protein YukD
MAQVNYQIQILDINLNVIAEVVTPYPLDKSGMILQYSKELSDYGQCKFRISAFDQMLTQYGDIIKPMQYHVRIRRNNAIVWQGAIIENSKRTKDFIEIIAAEYLFFLDKILVNRSSNDPATGTANQVFRIFNTGGMDTAVTTIMNETITTFKTPTNGNQILANMTLGTIENPNFPPNMTNNLAQPLTGAWNFSTNLQLTFDFQSIYYILKSFGVYSYADFYIDNNLVFNFKKFVGNDHHYDVNFTFTKHNSNIIDYNLPRFGQRMVNDLVGIATDNSGVILHKEQTDQASISTYGLMQGVAAYADVKDQGLLNARVAAELPFVGTPDETNVSIVLNETAAYPLGQWDIGDLVTVAVTNNAVSFSDTRRVVGATVQVNSTGRELTTAQTNKPLPFQFGASNG